MKTTPESEALRLRVMNELSAAAKNENIKIVEISKMTGISQNNISRIFSGKYSTSIDLLLLIAEAIGYELQWVKKK